MNIISVRELPDFLDISMGYIQRSWNNVWFVMYEDCISHSITANSALSQLYLLEDYGNIIGCASLIGYYETYEFEYTGQGYDPRGEETGTDETKWIRNRQNHSCGVNNLNKNRSDHYLHLDKTGRNK